MSLQFDKRGQDVVFERAPLTVVLCQVKFEPILSLLAPDGIIGFQEALRDAYPQLESEEATEVELGGGKLAISNKAPVWRLRDGNEQWEVSLAVDFAALQTHAYSDFSDFAKRLDAMLDVLDRTVHPSDSTRVGLRKVNDLAHPQVEEPGDWRGLLRQDVLGVVGSPEIPAGVESSLTQTTFEDGKHRLAVRHGVLQDAADTYRLDLDYFTEEPLPVVSGGELVSTVTEFSEGITSFFKWALEDAMYDYLEPHPRG